MSGSLNHFELFDLPVEFDLDRAALDTRYRELQRELHPDRHAHKGERDQREAVEQTANLNDGYATLKSPFRRAQYMLKLQGLDAGDESRAQLPVDFLMQQMELREQLAEVKSAADPFAELEKLERRARVLETEQFDQFRREYADGDYQGAERTLRRLQFVEKLLKETEAMEERLDEEF